MGDIVNFLLRPEVFGPCTAIASLAMVIFVCELPRRLERSKWGVRAVLLRSIQFTPLVILIVGVLFIATGQSLEQFSYLAEIMSLCGGAGLLAQFVGHLEDHRKPQAAGPDRPSPDHPAP